VTDKFYLWNPAIFTNNWSCCALF